MSVLTREGFHALQAQAADALARSQSALTVLICALSLIHISEPTRP